MHANITACRCEVIHKLSNAGSCKVLVGLRLQIAACDHVSKAGLLVITITCCHQNKGLCMSLDACILDGVRLPAWIAAAALCLLPWSLMSVPRASSGKESGSSESPVSTAVLTAFSLWSFCILLTGAW